MSELDFLAKLNFTKAEDDPITYNIFYSRIEDKLSTEAKLMYNPKLYRQKIEHYSVSDDYDNYDLPPSRSVYKDAAKPVEKKEGKQNITPALPNTEKKDKKSNYALIDLSNPPPSFSHQEGNKKLSPEVDLFSLLGAGSYGKVYKTNNSKTVTKIIRHSSSVQGIITADAIREVSFLRLLAGSKHILRMQKCKTSLVDTRLNLDFYPTTLRDKLIKFSLNPPESINQLIISLAEGLYNIHSMGLIHGDIKPENILCTDFEGKGEFPSIAIADFGIAILGNSSFYQKKYHNVVQSLWYRSPEVLSSNIRPGKEKSCLYTEKIDVWSMGIIFEMLASSNSTPLVNSHDEKEQLRLINLSYSRSSAAGGGEEKDEYRLNDSFFTDLEQLDLFSDLLKGMINLDENKRLSSAEVLKHPYMQSIMKTKGKIEEKSPHFSFADKIIENWVRYSRKLQSPAPKNAVDSIEKFIFPTEEALLAVFASEPLVENGRLREAVKVSLRDLRRDIPYHMNVYYFLAILCNCALPSNLYELEECLYDAVELTTYLAMAVNSGTYTNFPSTFVPLLDSKRVIDMYNIFQGNFFYPTARLFLSVMLSPHHKGEEDRKEFDNYWHKFLSSHECFFYSPGDMAQAIYDIHTGVNNRNTATPLISTKSEYFRALERAKEYVLKEQGN